MAKKSFARLVRDGVRGVIPAEHLKKINAAKQARALATARARAADAAYNEAMAEGLAAAGIDLDAQGSACMKCGTVSSAVPNERGLTPPCATCYPPKEQEQLGEEGNK